MTLQFGNKILSDELASDNNLSGFKHHGFWQPMDTLRDKIYLNKLWEDGNAKWKIWK